MWLWSTVNIHSGAVTDSKHIHLKTIRWICAAAVPTHKPHARKIILQAAAIPRFQTEMVTKRKILQTAALKLHIVIMLH